MAFRAVRLFAERARAHARARLVRSQEQSQRAVKHTERLVKNFSPRGLAWRAPDRRIRLESTESPPGDSVETAVGGRRRRTKIRRRRSPSGKISQRFFLSPAVHLRSSEAEFRLEQIVHRFRIGLAAGRLHHLTDEPTREC